MSQLQPFVRAFRALGEALQKRGELGQGEAAECPDGFDKQEAEARAYLLLDLADAFRDAGEILEEQVIAAVRGGVD